MRKSGCVSGDIMSTNVFSPYSWNIWLWKKKNWGADCEVRSCDTAALACLAFLGTQWSFSSSLRVSSMQRTAFPSLSLVLRLSRSYNFCADRRMKLRILHPCCAHQLCLNALLCVIANFWSNCSSYLCGGKSVYCRVFAFYDSILHCCSQMWNDFAKLWISWQTIGTECDAAVKLTKANSSNRARWANFSICSAKMQAEVFYLEIWNREWLVHSNETIPDYWLLRIRLCRRNGSKRSEGGERQASLVQYWNH